MANIIENKIKTYSNMLNQTEIADVHDFVNDRFNTVHNNLFEDALNKLLTKMAQDAYEGKFEDNIILDKAQLDVALLSSEKMSLSEFTEAFIKYARRTRKIIEIKNPDYSLASSVYVVNTEFPYDKKKYSLEKYWNTIEHETLNKSIKDLRIDDETLNYAELVYVDYVKGICKYKSKLNNKEFWVPFDYIKDKSEIDQYSKLNTFRNLLSINK